MISKHEARRLGDRLGIDWTRTSESEFRKGIQVELEHSGTIAKFARPGYDELEIAGSIALDHLKERSDYYSILKKVEGK